MLQVGALLNNGFCRSRTGMNFVYFMPVHILKTKLYKLIHLLLIFLVYSVIEQ